MTEPQEPLRFAYAYCHGFLSGPQSFKGQALQKNMLEVGVDMSLLNLNGKDNDPGRISCSGALDAVRQFHLEKKSASGDPGLKLRLVGSSFGGHIVARCAFYSTNSSAVGGGGNYYQDLCTVLHLLDKGRGGGFDVVECAGTRVGIVNPSPHMFQRFVERLYRATLLQPHVP